MDSVLENENKKTVTAELMVYSLLFDSLVTCSHGHTVECNDHVELEDYEICLVFFTSEFLTKSLQLFISPGLCSAKGQWEALIPPMATCHRHRTTPVTC